MTYARKTIVKAFTIFSLCTTTAMLTACSSETGGSPSIQADASVETQDSGTTGSGGPALDASVPTNDCSVLATQCGAHQLVGPSPACTCLSACEDGYSWADGACAPTTPSGCEANPNACANHERVGPAPSCACLSECESGYVWSAGTGRCIVGTCDAQASGCAAHQQVAPYPDCTCLAACDGTYAWSNATQSCECVADCAGKSCGEADGCGGYCTTCPTGYTCDESTLTCKASSPASGCQTDNDCGSGICVRNLNEGYCSAACTVSTQSADCAYGQHCFLPVDESVGLCVSNCSASHPCASSVLACRDGDQDGTSECLPGAADVGQACTSSSDCQGTLCTAGTPVEGYFPGGYCTASCGNQSPCPLGSHCTELFGTSGTTFCAQDCSASTDCTRSGYACTDSDGDQKQECMSTGSEEKLPTGAACTNSSECAGIACIRSSRFPNGYCSQACTDTSPCATGSVCAESTSPPLCFATCQTDSDCGREGYACTDTGLSTRVCWPTTP